MTVSLEINDLGLDAIFRRLAADARPSAAGVFSGFRASEAKGVTNAQLAAWHEFGVPKNRIPSRPVIRGTVERNKRKLDRFLNRQAARVVEGSLTKDQMMLGAAEMLAGEMKKTITRSIGLKSNRPSTVRQKGSSRPLVDTGQLKNSYEGKLL